MKKYNLVHAESLKKLAGCFTSHEELCEFLEQLRGICDEIEFSDHLMRRNISDLSSLRVLMLKKLFMFTLFCKQNIEVLHDLVNKIEYTEITETERKGIHDEFGKEQFFEM